MKNETKESEFYTNTLKGRVIKEVFVMRPNPENFSLEIAFEDGSSLYTQSTISYDVEDADLDVELNFEEDNG